MDRGAQAVRVLRALRKTFPDAHCELEFRNPFQLLVATILSAQCTDARVNKVTPGLFKKYPFPASFARADLPAVEAEVRSTGFFRMKAKSILGASLRIAEEHGGRVPRTLEELTALPGVARKTANVVLGTAFGVASGVVVDTHVRRLAYRLGLSDEKDPEKIEKDLMDVLPRKDWIFFGHSLIWHGRRICKAARPDCPSCPMASFCPKRGV